MDEPNSIQIDPEGTETKRLLEIADIAHAGRRRVLDIGCGDGRLTWRYANTASAVTAIDLDADQLRIAMIDRPGNLAEKVSLARADSVKLPFESEAFDLAVFAWSF